MAERMQKLGWWAITGEQLLGMLRRVAQGESPDVVYMEEYANADRRNLADSD